MIDRDRFAGEATANRGEPRRTEAPPMTDDRTPLADRFPELPSCESCRNLTIYRDRTGCRRCTAAAKLRHPVPDVGRRCTDFAPLPGDPERRTGAERWPGLTT